MQDEGEKTVVLAGKDATQLQLMAATATALNLPCHLVSMLPDACPDWIVHTLTGLSIGHIAEMAWQCPLTLA